MKLNQEAPTAKLGHLPVLKCRIFGKIFGNINECSFHHQNSECLPKDFRTNVRHIFGPNGRTEKPFVASLAPSPRCNWAFLRSVILFLRCWFHVVQWFHLDQWLQFSGIGWCERGEKGASSICSWTRRPQMAFEGERNSGEGEWRTNKLFSIPPKSPFNSSRKSWADSSTMPFRRQQFGTFLCLAKQCRRAEGMEKKETDWLYLYPHRMCSINTYC